MSHSQYKLRALKKLEKLTGKKHSPDTPLLTMVEEVAELTYRQISNSDAAWTDARAQGNGDKAFELLFDLLALSSFPSTPTLQDAYRKARTL